MPLRIGSRGGARPARSSRTLVAVPYPEPIRRSERDASYNPIGRAYASLPPQTTLCKGRRLTKTTTTSPIRLRFESACRSTAHVAGVTKLRRSELGRVATMAIRQRPRHIDVFLRFIGCV